MRARGVCVAVIVLLTAVSQGCSWLSPPGLSAGYLITPEIAFGPVQVMGEVFFSKTVAIMYSGGSARLSLHGTGDGEIMVDDVIDLDIVRPGRSTVNAEIDFSDNCSHLVAPLEPQEISQWLGIGENIITFTFRDKCGGGSGNTEIWLVMDGTP